MAYSMILFKVTTTFIGADKTSAFYFDSNDKAQSFLDKQDNGEIDRVMVIKSRTCDEVANLNYFDECTFNDLTTGYRDACVISIKADGEFSATAESVEGLLRGRADYIKSEVPATNILPWKAISSKYKSRLDLKGHSNITSNDVFVIDGIELHPVK